VRFDRRRSVLLALGAALIAFAAAQPASASKRQLAMFEDDVQMQAHPEATLDTFRALGVRVVRVFVGWDRVAPARRPAGFSPSNPGDPHYNWGIYDRIIRAAQVRGLSIDLTVSGGAPLWANGRGAPRDTKNQQWKPDAAQYGAFVRAIGARYSGGYRPAGSDFPLPAVRYWALWNEPNFGMDLGPQATAGSSVLYAPVMYRRLLDAGWGDLQATGHGHDTILIGSLAARGSRDPPSRSVRDGRPGKFGTTKPLQFVRALYCVDTGSRPLRGAAARAEGCPTTGTGSRAFARQHPGLFHASGFAIHPYPVNKPPTQLYSTDPDYAEFPDIPHVESVLDRIQRAYRSGARFPIYLTEFGYITDPPNRSNNFASPTTAAFYMNWAEYLMWRNPRIATAMQYLLADPNPRRNVPEFGGFADGLEFFGGKPKPGYAAYRLPLFLPSTTSRRGRSLEVWGCARPARYALLDTGAGQSVQIQFQARSRGAFGTLKTVPIRDPGGYFDVRVAFASSGSVRLAWSAGAGAKTYFSRTQKVTVR
jgi:hypothetical protein